MTQGKLRIGLVQFRVQPGDIFVSFEMLRALIDMLRFAGNISVEYSGGDSFILNVQTQATSQIIERFQSFGIKVTEEE